jgi:serine protease Do
MAKPSPRSEPPPSPRLPSPPSASFLLAYRVLKLAGFVVGLPAAQLCVMALIGALTDNGYARVLGAAAIVLGVPLALADRLLPSHDPSRARGLVSDVCAVTWMIITFAVAGAMGNPARPLLAREGDRLVGAGHVEIAQGAYLLAGLRVTMTPAPEAAPVGSGSAASGSAVDAGAASDGGAAGDAGVAAASDAGAVKPKTEKPADKTPAELFKEASPAVVTLSAFLSNHAEGGGTGFLIDGEGTIATNHHVIDGAAHVRVKFQSGAVFEDVELLVDEPNADLALLRVNLAAPVDGARVEVKPLALANSDDVVVGQHAVVIGNPLGLESTLTDGLVSSRRLYGGRAWIQFTAPIGSGNSGGPVLDMHGEVIGVTTASILGQEHGAAVAQNLNLAVPINELKKLLRADYPSRRKLGASSPGQW